MDKTVLIIDDENLQALSLKKSLSEKLSGYNFESYYEKETILAAIENRFFNLAVVDLRMDKLGINGIEIIERIFQLNPIAHIIIISAYKEEYFEQLKGILKTGKILDVINKGAKTAETAEKLEPVINDYYKKLDENISLYNSGLMQYYSDAKNEQDTFKKGILFERFLGLLFGSMGYRELKKRVIDTSRNEVDLIVRNETKDPFLNKFGKYFLIECKNKPDYKVGKNDFIVFSTKLKNSNGLSELGIIATTGGFAKTSYLEAMRDSRDGYKILFLSNAEFLTLILSENKLEDFKNIIDDQVKNN